MINYGAQFATICVLHLLAVATPGPDFAIVFRQSVTEGRRSALWTSLGIGSGILIHTAYSLLGLGVLLRSSWIAFTVMKTVAAAYLIFLGVKSLRGGSSPIEPTKSSAAEIRSFHARSAFSLGFMTNALNPKATLFFVAVFTAVIDPRTPRWLQAGYGLWMALVTALWFSLVALFFARKGVREKFLRFGHWFERAMGMALVVLGFTVAFAQVRK